MSPDLTLPGDIPGLLRRGSPVVKTWHDDIDADGNPTVLFTASGFYLRDLAPDKAGRRCLCWFDNESIGLDSGFPPALDLTDATGRAHAAWWLATKCAPEAVPVGTRMRCIYRDGSTMAYLDWHWSLDNMGGTTIWVGATHPYQQCVPSLAGLDPEDLRLLPDGSRWVDAEALRRVCLHVAGRPL